MTIKQSTVRKKGKTLAKNEKKTDEASYRGGHGSHGQGGTHSGRKGNV
jgi:hypothetical protein